MAVQAAPLSNFGLPVNPSANDSALTHVNRFVETANGAFRELQWIDRVLQSFGYDDLAKKFFNVWTGLAIPRLFQATTDMFAAISDETKSKVGQIKDVAGGIAAWGYAGLFFGMPVKNATDICTLTADVADLTISGHDFLAAEEHLKAVDSSNAPLMQRFTETSRYALLKVAKAVCSVASGVLGLLVLCFGGPVVPAGMLLALGLGSTTFAIWNHFYKETSTYAPVSFYENRTFTVNGHIVR